MHSKACHIGWAHWHCPVCGDVYDDTSHRAPGTPCAPEPEPRYRSTLPRNPAPVPDPDYDPLPDDGDTKAARAYKAASRNR